MAKDGHWLLDHLSGRQRRELAGIHSHLIPPVLEKIKTCDCEPDCQCGEDLYCRLINGQATRAEKNKLAQVVSDVTGEHRKALLLREEEMENAIRAARGAAKGIGKGAKGVVVGVWKAGKWIFKD